MLKIAGIFTSQGGLANAQKLSRMLAPLKQRSSAKTGFWTHPNQRLLTGLVDETSDGALPFWNETRDICLICCGETFPDRSELQELKARGHRVSDQEDASYIVHQYEEKGLGFLKTLNGCFCGVIVDLKQHFSALFVDRYAMGRLYFSESGDGFYFSSEAKSILAALPESRRFDEQSLAEFISVGCPLENRSMFEGISIVPGGSVWVFHDDGRRERKCYFYPEEWEQQSTLSPKQYTERLGEIFSRVVPRYFQGNATRAMSLTGGLDSRMIMAWANPLPGSLPCYTFGGPYRDCADVRIAQEIAKVCQQPHTAIRIKDDFFEEFPGLAEKAVYLSDGIQDVSGSVELYVNRLAARIAPVRITGNYGSEILRSNVAFKSRQVAPDLFTPEFQTRIDQAVQTYRRCLDGNRLSFITFKQLPWYQYARSTMEKAELTPRSPYLDNELVALAFQAPPPTPETLMEMVAQESPSLAAIQTDRAYGTRPISVMTWLMRARQELTIKTEYAYDYGMPKWAAGFDRFLAPLRLDRLLLGHHKFYHFRIWYRDRLNGYLRETGLGSAPFGYRSETIPKIVLGHLSGRSNHTKELHKLLTVMLVEKTLINHQWDI